MRQCRAAGLWDGSGCELGSLGWWGVKRPALSGRTCRSEPGKAVRSFGDFGRDGSGLSGPIGNLLQEAWSASPATAGDRRRTGGRRLD